MLIFTQILHLVQYIKANIYYSVFFIGLLTVSTTIIEQTNFCCFSLSRHARYETKENTYIHIPYSQSVNINEHICEKQFRFRLLLFGQVFSYQHAS